jgi:hypothetical protein
MPGWPCLLQRKLQEPPGDFDQPFIERNFAMSIRQLTAPAILAALLAASGSTAFAASVSEVLGRSSNVVSGATISVNRVADVATIPGRGHGARTPAPAVVQVMAGGEAGDFGRA